MAFVTDVRNSLHRVLTRPTAELSLAQRNMRFWWDLCYYCARETARNRATTMAAALTYRTLFSLVPVLVLSLVLFNAFAGFEDVQDRMQTFIFEAFNVTAAQVQAEVEGDAQAQKATGVVELLDGLIARIQGMNFRSLGVVGLAVLVWAALGLLITIEQSFNYIYNAPTGRSWTRRVAIYWAVITLGPVILAIGFYYTERLTILFEGFPMLSAFGRFTGLAATWMFFVLLYLLMPNAQVNFRPAIIGALVAGILWEIAKAGFRLYVAKAITYSALYGSLGLLPLFLFWVYLIWLIVLFGLTLTYSLQAMRGRKFERERSQQRKQDIYDAQDVIPIMAMIGRRFADGESIDDATIAQRLDLPVRGVARFCNALESAGLVHRVQHGKDDDRSYALALPPDRIPIARLLEVSHTLAGERKHDPTAPGEATLARLNRAQCDAAGDTTLAHIIDEASQSSDGK